MNLSSLNPLALGILPFAVILAICAFLLSFPSEGPGVANPPVSGAPEPLEAPSSPLATAEDPPKNVPEVSSAEKGAPPPVTAAPALAETPDTVSMMATWWVAKSRHHRAAVHKTRLSVRRSHRDVGIDQGALGCPPSICFGPAQVSAVPGALVPKPTDHAD
jgi:hypothetical protein